MDPNETLLLFRCQYRAYNALRGRGNQDAADVHARNATEHAAELFEWLARGGFPPDWSAFNS